MSASYGKHFSTQVTPQTEKAKATQVQNNAGGFVFALDKWARLDRWLILGAEGGTYYVKESTLTKDNAKVILECLEEDGIRTVNRIVEISDQGRAPKNDPAIFALAMAAGADKPETRAAALAALPKVCRIGTHLFHFVRDVEGFRKWGRSLRKAVSQWYTNKSPEKLAYDVIKYQQRDGWSHRDVLRLSHPTPPSEEHSIIFRYIAAGAGSLGPRTVKRRMADKSEKTVTYLEGKAQMPRILEGFEKAKVETDPKAIAKLVTEYGLTREMVPTSALNSVAVWEALLENMPLTAMIRNLGKMSNVGLLTQMSAASGKVIAKLDSAEQLHKARIHPLAVLCALKIYGQGKGDKGSLTWTPVPQVLDALDGAFYASFASVEPVGKNIMLALDVSGSMSCGDIAGMPLTPREATAAMAMVTARTEKNWAVYGFSTTFVELNISPRQRLDDVIKAISNLPFSGTDCSLPMVFATKNKLPVDVFQVYTDNETYFGGIHPFQALKQFRQVSGRQAKSIVVGTTATGFSIADPSDGGMLDICGFDTAAPILMSDFSRS